MRLCVHLDVDAVGLLGLVAADSSGEDAIETGLVESTYVIYAFSHQINDFVLFRPARLFVKAAPRDLQVLEMLHTLIYFLLFSYLAVFELGQVVVVAVSAAGQSDRVIIALESQILSLERKTIIFLEARALLR